MEQNNEAIKLFYKQAQQVEQAQQDQQVQQAQRTQQVDFNIETNQHKTALQKKIKSLFPQKVEEEEVEVEELLVKSGVEGQEEAIVPLTKPLLFKFLNQEIAKEQAVQPQVEKLYQKFLNEFLAMPANKDFAVEFLATNHETAIALMEINNESSSEPNSQLKELDTLLQENKEANARKLQNSAITKLIKDNLQDFLTKFFTVETTDERKNLLKEILEIEDISVDAIIPPTEKENKERFTNTFLELFNEDKKTVVEKAGEIIKNNLANFTEALLAAEAFEDKHMKLFANASAEVITKIVATITSEEEDKAKAKARTNATKIAFNNVAVLEEVAKKLSELATQQQEGAQKINAKAFIAQGIIAENTTIVKNLNNNYIKKATTKEIEILKKPENVKLLSLRSANIIDDYNNSDGKKKNLFRSIAYQNPQGYEKEILQDDFALSKQLNKTLTEVEESVIAKDNLDKIKSSLATQSTILKYDDRKNNLARSEITEDNKVKMSSIKLGLVNATQNSKNNTDDTEKLKTTLKTASSLIGSTKNNGTKDANKQITAKDITDSAVDFNRDRLKLLGLHRKVENNKYVGYEVDKTGTNAIKEFKELAIIKNLYKGKKSEFSGEEKNKWTVRLAFIEFMGYKTPEELSFLQITADDKNKKSKKTKIKAILEEIKTNFGWTLETGYTGALKFNEPMKLEYKEPSKETKGSKIFQNFVQQSINFLKIAEKAEEKEKNQPEETLKGSLRVKKVYLDELVK